MAIVKFESAQGAPKEGSSNALLWVIAAIGVAYLGYRFVYVPYVKRKQENAATK